MIVGIDHLPVAGPTGCESQAPSFYGELLELSELPKPPALGAALEALATRLAQRGQEPRWDAELPGARRFYLEGAVRQPAGTTRARALSTRARRP